MPAFMIIDQEIREAFLSEARGLLRGMNAALLKLEKNPQRTPLLADLLDSLHTFKGLSAAVRLEPAETACHEMEELLVAIQRKKPAAPDGVKTLFSRLDALEVLIEKVEPTTIEVKTAKLDALMKLAEELLIAKMRLDRIKESAVIPELTAAVEALARLTADIQYNVTQARMVPIRTLFERFPRMVRDIAKAQGKEVRLVVEGGEIELDRQVLDQMGEPLVHLLRNAVDHGIETPDGREKSGKPSAGTLRLGAKREKGTAVLEVEDDGRGLNMEAIQNEAVKRGFLSREAGAEEALKALFYGISTAPKVTPLSGRGLGLTIVKRAVDAAGGHIKVETSAGQGTRFAIEFPTTLAIVNALFVGVGREKYAIPVSNVVRLLAVKRGAIKGQIGLEALIVDKEDIPLVSLRRLFHDEAPRASVQEVVIVKKGEEKFGLVVDTLLATQEIVIKPLSPLVKKTGYFSGSTLVGSGEAVLVLDVASLAVMKKKQRQRGESEHETR